MEMEKLEVKERIYTYHLADCLSIVSTFKEYNINGMLVVK